MTVLINYQDPRDNSGIGSKLPTWTNDPIWKVSIKYASQITVEGTEPYFSQHDQRKKNDKNEGLLPEKSSGYYIIGLHSFTDCSFSIKASVAHRKFEKETGMVLDI